MKKILLFVFITTVISCKSQSKRAVLGDSDFQREMNAKFKDASKSPLTKKGLKEFKGLAFFPIDDKYKVKATLEKTPDAPIFNFPTTTSRIAVYKKYGILSFSIKGESFKLSIYKNVNPKPEYANNLFLPFLDTTNGKTSYKGGRFIDLYTTDIKDDGTIIIDFNKAYNPYCAYSDRYSCPITPQDNYLDTEIKAGVMAYEKPE
ncbi:DUF1684 domain-containing protein [Tenacibaculum tangerinum]|uniref:DUF1684 domain-containing protein n=1 Tax=Tenacibaculum tangerinum TaxID=3038772 RepID=A0ABY8L7A7_9FLAO|nr:DUF1684 domain-containing protein [Tenacibaculum tangerinum]WGH76951.1 DUF1684 domain-containing protein [Tenacibaculum tangerinum]